MSLICLPLEVNNFSGLEQHASLSSRRTWTNLRVCKLDGLEEHSDGAVALFSITFHKLAQDDFLWCVFLQCESGSHIVFEILL